MMHKVISIGRSAANEIVLNDETVSRHHARLIIHNQNDFELIDLDSTNGTFVNNKRINTKIEIQRNDSIQFGSARFDWSWIEPYVVQPNGSIKQHPHLKKSKNVLPILLFVGVALFFFWFLSKEKSTHPTNKVKIAQKTTNDSVSNRQQNSPISKDSIKNKVETPAIQKTKKPTFIMKSDKLTYSIACLRDKSNTNKMIGIGTEIENGWITFSSDEVGVSEEIKVGKELKKEVEKKYTFSNSPLYKKRIGEIFNRLMAALKNPRMKYHWYIIESKDINAFTAGGLIFITTGIIDFAKNNDELACVVGHEIYHNELGHINMQIRKEKAAHNWFGKYANWALIASNIAGASFNQENETYCDMYGVDLAIKAGYDGRAASGFWSRMESDSSEVDKLLSTHPFSQERMDCIDEHLERNYRIK